MTGSVTPVNDFFVKGLTQLLGIKGGAGFS